MNCALNTTRNVDKRIMAIPAATGASRNFDAVYTTSWGGSLLAPYVVFEASEETVLTFVDPFKFLGDIWPTGKFPAPDPSTRDGMRAFYTHIDGDGFRDVLWRHAITGKNVIWFLAGTAMTVSAQVPPAADTAWQVTGTEDGAGEP